VGFTIIYGFGTFIAGLVAVRFAPSRKAAVCALINRTSNRTSLVEAVACR
jgi:hypothetical protein